MTSVVGKEKKDLLYKDLTFRIRGAMFTVHNQLGSIHKESVYHKALAREFELQDIPFVDEKNIPVYYKGRKVGAYRPDFIVDDKVIVEIKATSTLALEDLNQIYYYVRGTSYKVVLIANFGAKSLDIRRRIYT